MSRFTGSKSKVSRRFGEPIFGREKEIKRPNPPGQHGAKRKRKVSEYGQQLLEKQKAKYIYGMREGQFRIFFERAMAKQGKTGDLLLQMCESRLDNVVYRLGIAPTRAAARQLVSHGHFLLNGRRVDIPSIRLNPGDVLEVRPKSGKSEYFKNLPNIIGAANATPLSWLKVDAKKMKIEVSGLPKREEAEAGINEQLIVEYYSR